MNTELQIRQALQEKISSLQLQIKEEQQHSESLVDAVTKYAERQAQADQKYLNLVVRVMEAAKELPDKHRRQIQNILPTL